MNLFQFCLIEKKKKTSVKNFRKVNNTGTKLPRTKKKALEIGIISENI